MRLMTWRARSISSYLEFLQMAHNIAPVVDAVLSPLPRQCATLIERAAPWCSGTRWNRKQRLKAIYHILASRADTRRGQAGVNPGSTCTALQWVDPGSETSTLRHPRHPGGRRDRV